MKRRLTALLLVLLCLPLTACQKRHKRRRHAGADAADQQGRHGKFGPNEPKQEI